MDKHENEFLDKALSLHKTKDQQLDELSGMYDDYIYHDFLDNCYYKLGDMWDSKKIAVNPDTSEYINTVERVKVEQLTIF